MKVVEVDIVRLELLERVLEGGANVGRVAVGETRGVCEAELGGEEDVLTLAALCEPLAKELFVVLIGVRGIPEGATTLIDRVQKLCQNEDKSSSSTIKLNSV